MLRDQEGIHSVKVALLAERGIIQYDPKVWTEDKLINVCLFELLPEPVSHLPRKYLILVSTRPSYLPSVKTLFSYEYMA